MAGPSVISLYILSGLCAYATLNLLSIALRRPIDRPHLLLAGVCLSVAGLGLSEAFVYQSITTAGSIFALKWALTFIFIFFICRPRLQPLPGAGHQHAHAGRGDHQKGTPTIF